MSMKMMTNKEDIEAIDHLIDRIAAVINQEDGWHATVALINVLGMVIMKRSEGSPEHMQKGYELVGTALSAVLAANTPTEETMN